MTEPFDETNISVDLARVKLFIVPVTYKLLTEPNRTMLVDIAYAKKNDIKIIPFLMESGIDDLYSLQSNFGDIQYINPNCSDSTEIHYLDKLKKQLDIILISDELSKLIRAEFDVRYF